MPQKTLSEGDLLKTARKKTLKEIKVLDLSDQGIGSIDVHLFHKLASCTELDLSDNHLQEVPRELTLPELESLDLSNNDVTSVEFVSQFPRLQALYLDGNQQMGKSDLLIAAFLCPTLEEGSVNTRSLGPLQAIVHRMIDKLSYKVKGVWEALFTERLVGRSVTEEERQELLVDFSAALLQQNLCDEKHLIKFYNFVMKSMAAEIIKSVGASSSCQEKRKRVPKRKLDTIYEEDTLSETPRGERRKTAHEDQKEKSVTRNKRSKSAYTSIKPKYKSISRAMFKLPTAGDYSPAHLVRCHSYDNDPDDQKTKVWRCGFEPNPEDPAKQTDIVGTCGGLSVCLLDCKTGKVMKRYKDDDEDESFYCLAWTTVTMKTKGTKFPTNLLAVAGRGEVIKLMHPRQLVIYAALKGHRRAIQALLFHPDKPSQLFCGSDDYKITAWDIGIPDPVTYSTKYSQLFCLQCPGTSVLNLVYSSCLHWLVAGCEGGCFGWDLNQNNRGLRQPSVEFCLPESKEDPCIVDGLVMLPNDVIATKVVGQSVICLWRLEDHVPVSVGWKMTKVMVVDAVCGLSYPLTDTPYINMSYSNRQLVVGDDAGSVLLYNIGEMARKSKFTKGVAPPSRELLWPDVSISQNSPVKQQTPDQVIVNMSGLRSDGRYLVSCTDNNLVCIWCKD